MVSFLTTAVALMPICASHRTLGISLAQCRPQRVIQIRLLPGAPARIEALRDCDAAVAEGLRDRPNIDARLQQFDCVRVTEVVARSIYSSRSSWARSNRCPLTTTESILFTFEISARGSGFSKTRLAVYPGSTRPHVFDNPRKSEGLVVAVSSACIGVSPASTNNLFIVH